MSVNFLRTAAAASLAVLLSSGCVYTGVTEHEDGSKVFEVNTTGWYLFDLIPVVTGDASVKGGGTVWFTDTCNAISNMNALRRVLAEEQAKLPEGRRLRIGPIVSHEVDEGVLVFLVNRHEFRTSVMISK